MVVYVCYWLSLLFLIYLTDLLNKAYQTKNYQTNMFIQESTQKPNV